MDWHTLKPNAIREKLDTDFDDGLSYAEAVKRLNVYGANILGVRSAGSFVSIFLRHLFDLLGIIIIGCSILAVILLEPPVISRALPFFVIIFFMLLSAILLSVLEYKALKCEERLLLRTNALTMVIRDGEELYIPVLDVVPGDVLSLSAGDIIPADCHLISGVSLRCDEHILTGNSLPAYKNTSSAANKDDSLGERYNILHAGCTVVGGTGRAVVVATSHHTELSRKLSREKKTSPITALPGAIPLKASRIISVAALVISVAVFGINVNNTEDLFGTFLSVCITAFHATPQIIFIIAGITLSRGADLAEKSGFLLPSIERLYELAFIDTVYTELEITLLSDGAKLTAAWTGEKLVHIDDACIKIPDRSLSMLKMAALSNNASLSSDSEGTEIRRGNPYYAAIAHALHCAGVNKNELLHDFPCLMRYEEADSDVAASVCMFGSSAVVVVIGSADKLLPRCTDKLKADAEAFVEHLSEAGEMVFAVALKHLEEVPAVLERQVIDSDLDIIGLVSFSVLIDPLEKKALQKLRENGITPIVSTSLTKPLALSIGRKLGLCRNDSETASGETVNHYNDENLKRNIKRYGVYYNVSAAGKSRVISALKNAGGKVLAVSENTSGAARPADIVIMPTGDITTAPPPENSIITKKLSIVKSADMLLYARGLFWNMEGAIKYLLTVGMFLMFMPLASFITGMPPMLPGAAVSVLSPILLILIPVMLVTDNTQNRSRRGSDIPGRSGLYRPAFFVRTAVFGLVCAFASTTAAILTEISHDAEAMPAAVTLSFLFISLMLSLSVKRLNLRGANKNRRLVSLCICLPIIASLCMLSPLVCTPLGLSPIPAEALIIPAATTVVVAIVLIAAKIAGRAVRGGDWA